MSENQRVASIIQDQIKELRQLKLTAKGKFNDNQIIALEEEIKTLEIRLQRYV